MTRMTRRAGALVLGAALLAACNREPKASVEELYTTRVLGQGYLQRNQLAEAESAFAKLARLAPDDPFGHASLGVTYLQAGRLADAERSLKRARELDPAGAETGLALARLYAVTNRRDDARATLEQLRRDSTTSARVLYALAELDAGQADPASAQRREARLREAAAAAPANLAVRLALIDALAARGAPDSVVRHLEEVRRIPPEPPAEARAALDSAILALRAGAVAEARPLLGRMRARMETTAPYQASLEEVKWTEGPIPGRSILTFVPKDFIAAQGVRERATVDVAKFVDATGESGFAGGDTAANALAAGDIDGDGTDDVFAGARLYTVRGGFVQDATGRAGIALPRGAVAAAFADVDNDGWLDLFAIGGEGRAHLFRNDGTGKFTDATARAGIAAVNGARKALFVDLDHDGDLDLLLVGGAQRAVWRNNLDGTFTESAAALGLAGPGGRDAAFGDFDGDGRVDLVVTGEQGTTLLRNGGASRFADAGAASGLAGAGAALAAGDYDNDGGLDLLVAGAEPVLWRNRGDGVFARDARSAATLGAARGAAGASAAAAFTDHDNDGWLDLVVTGPRSVHLLRNDGTGRFVDRSALVPAPARAAGGAAVAATDADEDGDEDLVIMDAAGAPRLLRNEMGNANLAVRVELKGLRDGQGKNNAFGIGARLELRAGRIYQTRVATSRVTHFGLGPHLKADVLRVEWPNGVPQVVYLPGTDQDVVEREMLKGSCAFVYTWDGTRFRFVTDAMWRSALGMPLGLMGGASAFAPAGASQEYVRIDGSALVPKDGRYVLQLTEELWETAYADEVKLLAVDHPDSVEVFVDERFVPPGPVTLELYQVARRTLPRSAVDERGTDLLPALRDVDDVFVSNFTPTRYQGVVEPHDLVLDLGPEAGQARTHLFLRGWIYPTDASINVALSQQTEIQAFPPSLEVIGADGRWKTVTPSLGFPSGKDKTMVIDLAGIFPTSDHRVRLRTSMQIYWDHAFVGHTLDGGASASAAKVTTLAPVSADLHARGFSRMFRKGGRYGPYWFDYADVTKESPWRPITGSYTRFGDVLPLLDEADDMYVIMAPGDEATVAFDASSAASVPKGWTRDFLLYTDGWIKDSDLNTAHGTTVEPLPFHAVKSYPYSKGDAYPSGAEHERYRREYNTRVVGGRTARER